MTSQFCGYCSKQIRMMCRMGTGFCSEQCVEHHEKYLEERDWPVGIGYLDHRLEALKLPTRVHNLLVDAGYTTVEQVRDYKNKLDDIKGYGFTASQIVAAALYDWERHEGR